MKGPKTFCEHFQHAMSQVLPQEAVPKCKLWTAKKVYGMIFVISRAIDKYGSGASMKELYAAGALAPLTVKFCVGLSGVAASYYLGALIGALFYAWSETHSETIPRFSSHNGSYDLNLAKNLFEKEGEKMPECLRKKDCRPWPGK